ncbi:phosphatidylethanolamine N-methyltransferase family protein [Maritimibacter sp. DP1N21-5]|uniref:phosphatidylethanolamine N-methyltransferase family protein n=1 Tax=Maritimibacter sp. DP1N21-5 TaxID=2836867 RepID=UPI001C44A44E|nr:phosphatidylethanolamine N-methyltransferase family protein [Maritimibacter sp. DP1N21-5]MBV7408799.1 phosphatidylethanolamine N-methyltransferase family protein [Maritimibacter sp. DP1N21-5]
MATLDEIREKTTVGQLFEGQAQHLLLLVLLLVAATCLLTEPPEPPRLLGLTARGWALTSIAVAVVHQAVVAVVFRLQLHHATLSRLFGQNDLAIWTAVFMPFLVLRPVTLFFTGWADPIPITGYRLSEIIIGTALLVPAIWGMHSTLTQFTLRRAVGGDHFRESIRALPPVKGGIFDYTDNGMYGVVFLGLWGIALLLGSWNALVVAAFQHAFIWVHFYTVEQPDMRRLYG